MAQLLITGGAGFIGSHTCLALLESGHNLVVIDNFSNSSEEALRRVSELAGLKNKSRMKVIKGDIRSSNDLDLAFAKNKQKIEAVIHFAGLKAVEESLINPDLYWDINVIGSKCLLNAMKRNGCKTIVFSSSATVYGDLVDVPVNENATIKPINPYGKTKAEVERILSEIANQEAEWRVACLRYFNPVGAHSSGYIGEAPNGVPTNLFPYVCDVAGGKREFLSLFGADWPTPDGTAIRDYIHVMDLAEGHCAAMDVLINQKPQFLSINLGSGKGHSVLEVLRTFEKVTAKKIPYRIIQRRKGDVAISLADPSFAKLRLDWITKRSLFEMCRDSWNWQMANPFGYEVENFD